MSTPNTGTTGQLDNVAGLVKQFQDFHEQYRFRFYQPYRWQQEFHASGIDNPERMLMAANRVGKTQTAAAETTLHLTGLYDELAPQLRYADVLPNGAPHPNAGEQVWPNGWCGKRFDHPVLVWTGSPTNETSRDIVQNELLGSDLGENLGTGWIPKHLLVGKPRKRQAGVNDVVESFKVRHKNGGLSSCMMKTYEQGWKKWQGTAPHVVWQDEEPDDYMIFSEAQTRILSSGGILMVTFTPLSGVTDLVEHFQTGGQGIYLQGATWHDAPHLDEDDKARLTASYRAHERDARTQGVPMMGEGAVFPISDDDIMVPPQEIPQHWAIIKGCDFGIDHPAAGAVLAWDRDADILYVIDCYKKANETAPYHAAWLNKSFKWAPVSWPHDGMNREKSGGKTLAEAYREHGANMLSKSARYNTKEPGQKKPKGGPQPVEPVVDEILERMMTGRFKVFSHLREWFDEKRSYHRKDGRIVARRDDIMKATQYAVMMKRYATTPLGGYRTVQKATVPIASSRIST